MQYALLRIPVADSWRYYRGFKAATTTRINEIRQSPGAPVWQRNYYEHVIRNDHELQRIREYIAYNPATDGIESIFGGERP
jgi:REP element-mobilizing transposase RayT